MESLITQRVREFLSYNSISINSLAKQINVAQATLNPQLRGDRTLAANIVVKILEAFPDISAEWLLRGEGVAGTRLAFLVYIFNERKFALVNFNPCRFHISDASHHILMCLTSCFSYL